MIFRYCSQSFDVILICTNLYLKNIQSASVYLDVKRNCMSKYFEEALGNMVRNVSSGDAIRHLADLGMNIYEICDKLTFPTPVATVRDIVWKHYLDKGIVSLEDPSNRKNIEISYVEDIDKYGRKSFRRVTKELEADSREYIKIDFGRKIYQDKAAFEASLSILEKSDRDYIMTLPWPINDVWHVRNERMERILGKYKL